MTLENVSHEATILASPGAIGWLFTMWWGYGHRGLRHPPAGCLRVRWCSLRGISRGSEKNAVEHRRTRAAASVQVFAVAAAEMIVERVLDGTFTTSPDPRFRDRSRGDFHKVGVTPRMGPRTLGDARLSVTAR